MAHRGAGQARRWGWLIAAAALVLDQASKNLLIYGYDFGRLGPLARIVVLPFLDLVMVWNRGVSYGLLPAGGMTGTLLLTAFSLIAVAVLSWWMARADRITLTAGLGLIIGGALGNVIDRILYGAVADFFHLHAFGRDWYVFNIADAAITIGVLMLLLDAFFGPERAREGKGHSGT